MSFPNLYYKRTTATGKACYICYKPTTTVLATVDTTDFLYTCTNHLVDRGFADRVVDENETKKTGLSPEEIAKVKEEWEERQKRKKEKEKEKAAKEKEKVEKDKDKDKKDEKKDETNKNSEETESKDSEPDKQPPGSWTPGSSASPKPTHERYILHRDIYALRVSEHRKRRQAAQAKDLAPRLPGIPRGIS